MNNVRDSRVDNVTERMLVEDHMAAITAALNK
jgi:hypothetical protein